MAAISDPIADFLTRIRNATRAQHRYVEMSWSRIKEHIAEILKTQGFIESVLIKKDSDNRGVIRLYLKYTEGRRSVIQGIQRASKPGWRRYIGHQEIPRFYGNYGLSILSTSQGIMAGAEAINKKVGGELLCLVW